MELAGGHRHFTVDFHYTCDQGGELELVNVLPLCLLARSRLGWDESQRYMLISSTSNTEKKGAGVTDLTPSSVITPRTRIGTI